MLHPALHPTRRPGEQRPNDARSKAAARLSILLLALAISTTFVFGNDRGHFYRPSLHDTLTANHMAIVENLSADHNFVRFHFRTLQKDGTARVRPYHRFPPGTHWLLKLTTLPFGDGLSEKLYAARQTMLCFFAATMFLAYLSACRLAANRWVSTTATAFAFAGYYPLYYNDAVGPEVTVPLFGVFLVFHGMVIFEHERRFAQLLIKVCGALLLTWHVFPLLLTFIVLSVGNQQIMILRAAPAPPPSGRRWNRMDQCLSLFRSRYFALGLVSLIFGAMILAFGLVQESSVMNGERSLTELPTVRSALGRVGVRPENVELHESFAWPYFLKQQALRITAMCIPYALYGYYADTLRDIATAPLIALGVVLGVAVSVALLTAIRFARNGNGTLLATMVLWNFSWALPMRYNTFFHDFESSYYIGIPFVLSLLLLREVHKRLGEGWIRLLAVCALVLFSLSSLLMSRIGNDSKAASLQQILLADFDAIRNHVPEGEAVAVPLPEAWRADLGFAGVARGLAYYLSGRTIVYHVGSCGFADFVITAGREDKEGWRLLTSDNRLRFLYERPARTATGHCADTRP